MQEQGWWKAHRWLLLRRLSQLSILLLFLAGPLWGVWIIKGNLAASLTLDLLPLSDPLVVLQELAAGQTPLTNALLGAGIIALFYALLGGRVFCAWVCPVNPISDAANWLRQRLGLKGGAKVSRSVRYWLLAAVLVLAAVSGALLWELINPVHALYRALLFGVGWIGWMAAALFVLELVSGRDMWCGHLCPMGAFYALLGRFSLLRVTADARARCNECMDCYAVCPEPTILSNPVNGAEKGLQPLIDSGLCSNCGRCIDVCARDVFRFAPRWNSDQNPSVEP
ncbi:putative ferredoxin-type protein NapH [Magnetofaba australis IT-1]|uniref:Putative ferredoxin-type protein NapH n=1 Tax=Magnetofaba australis IT-1 TaxID=1434232 RepID=A0A1Y2K7A7_9PROT|nr:putative ferredoxin-type protein NapH [Magnetofaba australis IT-1]